MTSFLIRRLLQAIPTFFGITVLSYMIIVLAPGDPVTTMTFDPNSFETQAQRDRVGDALGVNDSLVVQYLRWLTGDDWMRVDTDGDNIADRCIIIQCDRDDDGVNDYPPGSRRGVIRLDFGKSFAYKTDTLALIGRRLPATIELNIAVIIVGVTLGVPIGVMAAVWRGSLFDNSTRFFAVIGNAIPDFWMGFLLILLFGSVLGLLPLGGRAAITSMRGPYPPVWERLEYLILPTTVGALGVIAGYSRYMRTSMLETVTSDYVRTARAKGLPENAVWFRHALRNALIPLATFLGPLITSLLGGSTVIERIFGWPGVGLLLLEAVNNQDYPVIMASVVIGASLTILGYMISDVLYAVFDPRIRY